MDQLNSNATPDEQSDLELTIKKWRQWLLRVAIAMVLAYFIYFVLIRKMPAATEPSHWGAFGDFVGGLMNPIVAFAAFYWLTKSVQMQKQELEGTRREVRLATEAQQLLVKNGRQSVRLAALTAVSNETRLKINSLEEKYASLTGALQRVNKETNHELYEKHRQDQEDVMLEKLSLEDDLRNFQAQMREILVKTSDRPERHEDDEVEED